MHKQLLLCGTAALGLLASAPAFADQITFGPSVQDVAFAKSGAGLQVSVPQLDFAAFDTTNSGLSGAWIVGLNFTTGPESNGLFSANPNSATFKYLAQDGDTLIETIHVTQVQDDTTQPKVYFIGDPPSAISGDAAFLAAFSGPDVGDWIQSSLGVTLTALVGSASSAVSAGEKIPASSPVPEPASLLLLASAMFGLAWLNRRRIRRNGLG